MLERERGRSASIWKELEELERRERIVAKVMEKVIRNKNGALYRELYFMREKIQGEKRKLLSAHGYEEQDLNGR